MLGVRASSALATFALSMTVAACFSDGPLVSDESGGSTTTGEPVCNAGAVTCPCYGNGTCDAGLTCQPDVVLCIPEDCTPGTLNCTCDQGGCVAAGTECIDGLCQEPPASDDGGSTTAPTSGSETVADDATGPGDSTSDDATGSTGADCATGVRVREGCARFVFVLDDGLWTPLMGTEAADTLCSSTAGVNLLPGTYVAYLATNSTSAMARAQIASGDGFVYVKPPFDGPVVVASDGGSFDVTAEDLLSPIDRFANGTALGGTCGTNFVYTGVAAPKAAALTCNDWSGGAGVMGDAGDPLSVDPLAWQNGCGAIDCATPGRVYCVQVPGTD